LPQTNSTPPAARALTDRAATGPKLENLTPTQIVAELDKYIIGQTEAKRAVAVALRNRYRRQLLPDAMRQEVQPKNILMIGPTGVGKTEIARRVARIVEAPFVKVEATKFTEVGYVGRDVESIVRDLVETAISDLHNKRLDQVKEQATALAVQRLAELLVEQVPERLPRRGRGANGSVEKPDEEQAARAKVRARKRFLQLLSENALEEETVEIEVEEDFAGDDYGDYGDGPSPEDLLDTFQDFLGNLLPRRPLRRKVSVREARRILTQQEANRLVDFDAVINEAIDRVEDAAVVFLDEIDKTIPSNPEYGADVSAEGVQRDLLPIVEGLGRDDPLRPRQDRPRPLHRRRRLPPVAAVRPHPELQGRFPIRVELQSLTEEDLYKILIEPENALTKQYEALLATEGLTLLFQEDGMREMARLATLVNQRNEDIGARRLQTIIEKVVEEVSFDAEQYTGQTIAIDRRFVERRVGDVVEDIDLSSFIL
jgi:ATP-dependent HslUV protease ATP-binding subunit HslU